MLGANGLMAAQTSNSWLDQWYRAKFGRLQPKKPNAAEGGANQHSVPGGNSTRSRASKRAVRAVVQGEVWPLLTG